MNNTKCYTIRKTVEEDRVNLWEIIDQYNCKEYPTNYRKYHCIPQVYRAEIKEIQDNRIIDTPISNNQPNNHTNSLPTKKTLFKDTVQQPLYNSFMILHYHFLPEKNSTRSNSTGKRGTSTRSLIWCNVTSTITANNNSALAIGISVKNHRSHTQHQRRQE